MSRNDIIVTALLALQATLAIIVATSPTQLGIPPIAAAWIGVAAVPVGVILNRLDTIGASIRPSDLKSAPSTAATQTPIEVVSASAPVEPPTSIKVITHDS